MHERWVTRLMGVSPRPFQDALEDCVLLLCRRRPEPARQTAARLARLLHRLLHVLYWASMVDRYKPLLSARGLELLAQRNLLSDREHLLLRDAPPAVDAHWRVFGWLADLGDDEGAGRRAARRPAFNPGRPDAVGCGATCRALMPRSCRRRPALASRLSQPR
eukprot:5511629-Prymnesium_polylepis.2